MRLITKTPGVMIEEVEYKPTMAELYYFYSGTHSGLNPDNPYAPKRGRIKKLKFIPNNHKKRTAP